MQFCIAIAIMESHLDVSHTPSLSRVMHNPVYCIYEHKGVIQLRGNLCFNYIVQSLYFQNPKVNVTDTILCTIDLAIILYGLVNPHRILHFIF